VATIVDYPGGLVLPDTPTDRTDAPATTLACFRRDFYRCLTRRADALFELADAVLRADGPVTSLAGLPLAAEHRRGPAPCTTQSMPAASTSPGYGQGLPGLPLPRMGDGRIVLTVDVSSWLRPDAATSADRLFCHVYGRGKEPGPADPRLAVLVRRRAGAGPRLMDGDPGRGTARPRRRRHGSHRQAAAGRGRPADRRRTLAPGRPGHRERTFSWINRCRRTVRDHERLPAHHAAMVYWSMIIIMADGWPATRLPARSLRDLPAHPEPVIYQALTPPARCRGNPWPGG
jgi:transposase